MVAQRMDRVTHRTLNKDIEFFTFFLGLQNHELDRLRTLFESFPHFDTHRLHVLDKSHAVRKLLQSGVKKFYSSWREYTLNPKQELNRTTCDDLFASYGDRVNRIVVDDYTYHGQGVDYVLRDCATSRYVVIMDSDIEFISDRYLADMIALCNRYAVDDLAAIGTIVQGTAFYLSLNPKLPPEFYNVLVRDSTFSLKYLFRNVARTAIKQPRDFVHMIKGTRRRNGRSKLPRFHPLLLLVNREIFLTHKMSFQTMFLDVLDVKQGNESKHRVMGDSGASFFYQCALAGKHIVNIDYHDYVRHPKSGSFATHLSGPCEDWSWFNDEISDDPHPNIS